MMAMLRLGPGPFFLFFLGWTSSSRTGWPRTKTYIYAVGSGNDSIGEGATDGTTDIIKLVALNPSDVTFIHVSNSNHLVIQINSTGETVTVQNQFNGTDGIEQVLFADGSTWDRSQIQTAAWYRGTASGENIYGSGSADTIDGKGGNDYLEGRGGGDTYIYAVGSGNDSIGEGPTDGSTDIVKLVGLNSSDITFIHVNNSNHLAIQINSTGETLTVQNQFDSTNGIEQVLFADGSTWDRSQIQAAAWYRGTSGNDSIQGSSASDILTGNQGNDYLRGNGGSDTYVYASGQGNDEIDDESNSVTDIDTLKFANVNANDVTLTRTGEHLMVTINPTGETIKIDYQFYSQSQNWGIEQFQFANGDTWDLATINANAWYRGTNGNDSIAASSWNDTLMGNQGNDYLRGNGGSDIYVYASGHGNDEIDDQSSSVTDIDTLKFTNVNANDVTLTRTGEHLLVAINPTGETIKIDYQFYSQSQNWGVEKFQFANGETWDLATINANAAIRGTSGNDTISGTPWNDTVAGGAGNDTMSGGAGNDIFVFRTNLGQDVVTDFTVGSDLLEFRDGNFADAAAALAAATTSGSDILITIDANNTVLLKNVSLANLHETDFHIV